MLPPAFTPALLRQLELLKLHTRRAFLGTRQGGHQSLKKGHGLEFSDYRRYELGDNPRTIDWGVYARSDKLYVKRFQEEQNLQVLLLLDGSASMHTPESDSKWENARDIALALAYIALLEQDSVRVSVLGSYDSPTYSSVRSIHHLSEKLLTLTTPSGASFIDGVKRAAVRVKFPGVAICISDFLVPSQDLEAGFAILRAKNLEITAIQTLGANDLNPLPETDRATAIDSETGEEIDLSLTQEKRELYAAELRKHNTRLAQFFSESGIHFMQLLGTMPLSTFVSSNLVATGLLR